MSFRADLRDDPVAAYDRAWRNLLTVPRANVIGFHERIFWWLGMSSWAVTTLDKALEKIEKGMWWYVSEVNDAVMMFNTLHFSLTYFLKRLVFTLFTVQRLKGNQFLLVNMPDDFDEVCVKSFTELTQEVWRVMIENDLFVMPSFVSTL